MRFEIPDFSSVRILVVGDVMLDRYWHGNTSRISPEAPVPILHVRDLQDRAGGAGNVALNLADLGCKVSLLGIIGQDSAGKKLDDILRQAHVNCHLLPYSEVPTIAKIRVLGKNQQLLRLDFEEAIENVDTKELFNVYEAELAQADLVILSDYGKGVLRNVQEFIQAARKRGIPVLIDPKSDDFSIYRQATLITPNLKEFEAVVGKCHDEVELEQKGMKLLKECQLAGLLVTRGEQGMTLLQENAEPLHLAARAREVYDVTGAGDTVISVLGAAIATGQALPEAAAMSNLAAGIVVQKLGAATVSVPELRRALQRHFDSELGILTEEQLMIAVSDAKAHHERIVMTNGCFDVLHAGHIAYLEQAKELGKRLIVAVNDDASVARLKGASRPINPLKERMAVLAALRVVDWVVAFSEDTPERLIKMVSPDVLVKGGDYAVHEIAGSEHVLSNGGEVKILGFVEGFSTTSIINRMRGL